MAYSADKKPGELTALTTLASDDVFVVGDTSDASEVAKGITKANVQTDLVTTAAVTEAGALMDSEVTDLAGVKALDTSTLQVKPSEGAFVDGDKTKLDGIEALADVTDTANVTAAGALMDSEVDADIKTLSLPANTTISAFGATLVDDADAATARTTLGVDAAGTDNSTDVTLAGTPDYITITGQTITRNQIDLTADVTGVLPEANLPDASSTAQGVVELATTAEVNTGTDATRAMSPDAFQASKRNLRWLAFNLVEAATDCATGTNIGGDFVSPIAGVIQQSDSSPFYLYATNSTAGTTGTMTIDININGTSIMTTNKVNLDTTEKTSTTAVTMPDLTTTALAVGDIITIDVDAVHTTAAKGLTVYMAVLEA